MKTPFIETRRFKIFSVFCDIERIAMNVRATLPRKRQIPHNLGNHLGAIQELVEEGNRLLSSPTQTEPQPPSGAQRGKK